jgi:uncharacterized protein (UPF0276 family)
VRNEGGIRNSGFRPGLREATAMLGSGSARKGLGLRGVHLQEILSTRPGVDFFEIISENAMGAPPARLRALDRVREHYPFALHGVSLSIGSTDPLDRAYLERLRGLIARYDPLWVSDHLSWTGVQRRNTHDLLPLPATEEVVRHVASRARAVQEILGRPLLLENPSAYLAFQGSTLDEAQFLRAVAEEGDLQLLLDLNNLHVSAKNLGFDAETALLALPLERVAYVHLAGHEDLGTHLLDTHSRPVAPDVWALHRLLCSRVGPVPTLIEWDTDIPPLPKLLQELAKIEAPMLEKALARAG